MCTPTNHPHPPAPPGSGPLLPVRTALVLLLAVLVGLAAAGLTYVSEHSVPKALLAGGGAAAAAAVMFNQLVG